MKRQLITFSLLLSSISVFSQFNVEHNKLRAGDELVKQQVEFRDPGESGRNKVWDFSHLKTINEEYTLSYSYPAENDSLYIMGYHEFWKDSIDVNNLIVGTEHHTMYYYHVKDNQLLLLGHENPSVKLQYQAPYVLASYPMSYGQRTSSSYTAQGLYSSTVDIETEGQVESIADAFGKMILPQGDTLSPVLRIKTTQSIKNTKNQSESIKQLETCRWYTKGYRYPIFETVRNINTEDSATLFATAFVFPPQEHLYLDTDPENQKLLDELWDFEDEEGQPHHQVENAELNISYSIYPNPVESILMVDYALSESADVNMAIYSIIDGKLQKRIVSKNQSTGSYHESIDCSRLAKGSYVLKIIVDGEVINEKIIKK